MLFNGSAGQLKDIRQAIKCPPANWATTTTTTTISLALPRPSVPGKLALIGEFRFVSIGFHNCNTQDETPRESNN